MMRDRMKAYALFAAGLALILSAADSILAQGRGAQNWNTTSADAQRTGWLRTETRISADAMRAAASGGFQLLWKVKPENRARQLTTLTQPLILGNLISHKGFKALAFFGGSDDVVYAYDYDLGRVYWSQKLTTGAPPPSATIACPGALTAITRSTPLAQSAIPGRGVGGIGGPPPGAGGRPPQSGINPANLPITSAVWAISSGGMVHALNPHIGADLRTPARIVPAGAKVSGSVLVDDVLYATTTDNCGGAPNSVWALDVSREVAATPKTWDTGGASIAGSNGPTLGLNNLLYVATGSGGGTYANAVVAIDPKTLAVKDWFAGDAPFTTSPVASSDGARDLVAAAARDGRLYVLDGKTPGGGDHKTPLARSTTYSTAGADFSAGAVSTWRDAEGERWLLVASAAPLSADTKFKTANGAVANGTIAAFKVMNQNDTLSLEPAWTSRDLVSPAPPIVLNDVVFALSTGALRSADAGLTAAQRLERSTPAVLYALDARTGKELWNSGRTIAASVQGVAPSGQDGQVYVVAADGTLYAFGIPMEH
jgi:outer membrane protein assembly factor BamB